MPRLLGGALVSLLLLLAACGNDEDGAVDDAGRDAAVYAAVILDVAETLPLARDEDPLSRTVFVESLEPESEIPLEVQADVVARLEDEVQVTFIDEREEAVVPDEEGQPVREHSALIAAGPVPEGRRRVVVEVRRYQREGDEDRLRYVVERVGDEWEVSERSLV